MKSRLVWLVLFPAVIHAQSTQGLIAGRILDSLYGRPITAATIMWSSAATEESGSSVSDLDGFYTLAQLSPGSYRVRVAASLYQPQELQELELRVAARLELDFRLRPLSDVWEQGQYGSIFLPGSKLILNFFGPDLDSTRSGSFDGQAGRSGTLETSMSAVIDPTLIRDLPLAGRDAYTALLLEPNVLSDQGTARGIGLVVNGQRPSASNFLLDGLENNNYLISGPLTPVAPEAIQEYRFSTNNYSAQYGRTGGFIANAVTKSGGSQFHGLGYSYLENDALNANTFADNTAGTTRRPTKQIQAGFEAGGPLWKRRHLFWSASFEQLRDRNLLAPQLAAIPTAAFIAAADAVTRDLLTRFPPPSVQPSGPGSTTGILDIARPLSINRSLALARLDYSRGEDTYLARVSIQRLSRPDFIWSPYPGFTSGLDDNAISVVGGYQHSFTPALLNEVRGGFNSENLGWNRANPDVPTLNIQDNLTITPGSPAYFTYGNKNLSGELLDNLTWTHGRHISVLGGNVMLRRTSGFLDLAPSGSYFFGDAPSFQAANPSSFYFSVVPPTLAAPDSQRIYWNRPWFVFAQDSLRVTNRLVLNYGLRYEHFGSPSNDGPVLDTLVTVKPGMSVWQVNSLQLSPNQKQLYRSDNRDWAPRAGVSYDVFGTGNTVLRAAYGLYYDRPFDNLWQTIRNNQVQVASVDYIPFSYLTPLSTIRTTLHPSPSLFSLGSPDVTMFDPNFQNGRVQSYFYGVQQRIAREWLVEINGAGSLGRHLITTDVINREDSVLSDNLISGSRLTPSLPNDVQYRAPQGSSSYQALTASVRRRFGFAQFQVSYTWSHSIDNQSEPLDLDTFNLNFTTSTDPVNGQVATFSRQFDSSADRGNSDFDQRQNLVFYSIWTLPSLHARNAFGTLSRNWQFSQLAAFRSGFPYSVYSRPPEVSTGKIDDNRADLIDPALANHPDQPNPRGGVNFLNLNAFSNPADSATLGNTGRNAFRGPGLYNIDFSLSRTIHVGWLGEGGSIVLRADAFNVLNHANLGTPSADVSNKGQPFGAAYYGSTGQTASFPSVLPIAETARQVQLLFRVLW